MATAEDGKFFQRTDWLSFAAAAAPVFTVYVFTLAPNVGLGFPGIFSVGAMYAGVPHPPGYPLWTLYGWVFIKILPVSNIAWRAGVASAVAGALTCGIIALLVSRCGARMANGISGLESVTAKHDQRVRVVCGAVAGMGFGFDGAFWWKALIADPWPLSLLMLSLVLCLLTRWQLDLTRTRWLLLAAFCFGLTLTNSQALAPAALGLPFFVLGIRPFKLAATAWLAVKCGVMLLLGLSLYLYVPVASMTNPPMNWGYARTVEGFCHTIKRGQYERIHPTAGIREFANQVADYAELAVRDFGGLYLLVALVPFCFLRRMQIRDRWWMTAMLAVFLTLSVVMIFLLNPSRDRQSREMAGSFYTASHLVLTIWSGCGLILIARRFGRSQDESVEVVTSPTIRRV